MTQRLILAIQAAPALDAECWLDPGDLPDPDTLPAATARERGWVAAGGIWLRLIGRTDSLAGEETGPGVRRRLLDLIRERGTRVLSQLSGPFAATIVDLREGAPQITLYREPLGREALHYAASGDALSVARTVWDLASRPGWDRSLDPQWGRQYFAQTRPHDNRTPFGGLRKVLPGEYVSWRSGAMSCARPDPGFGKDRVRYGRPEAYAERFRELLSQAVRRALPDEDGVTGVMLSGGMDSAPLAAIGQAMCRNRGGITAWSWSLPTYPDADETPAISRIADHTGCRLRLLPADRALPLRDVESWPLDPGSPLSNPFRPLKSRIYDAAAAEGIEVLFNGTAGDNLYPHPSYPLVDAWQDRAISLIARTIGRRLLGAGPLAVWRDPAFRRLLRHLVGRPARPPGPPAWVNESIRREWRGLCIGWPPEAKDHPHPDQVQATIDQLAADGGCEENHHAGRFGIEVRDPYRDPDLIDFMLSIPAYLCHRDGHTKWLARTAMADRLPNDVRWQPRRGILSTFFDAGFARERGNLRRIIEDPNAAWPAFVDADWVRAGLAEDDPDEIHKLVLWYCATFELWRRQVGV